MGVSAPEGGPRWAGAPTPGPPPSATPTAATSDDPDRLRPAWHEAAAFDAAARPLAWFWLVVRGAGWAIAIAGAALVLLRVAAFDDTAVLVGLTANTLWLFLPVYPVAALALAFGRWWLGGLGVVVVLCHVALVLPTMPAARTLPFLPRTTTRFVSVFAANVGNVNDEPGGILGEIATADPDLVVLEEYSPLWADALRRTPDVLGRYPIRVEEPRLDESGIAVLAKAGFDPPQVLDVGGWPAIRVETTFRVPGGGAPHEERVRVYGVHVSPPGTDFDRHDLQYQRLHDLVDADLQAGRGVVVVGDLEETAFNRRLRDLEGLGLHSAHEQRGRGLARTYPNGKGLHQPRIRLDHALLSRDLVVSDVDEGRGQGSDHRPVLVTFAVDVDELSVLEG